MAPGEKVGPGEWAKAIALIKEGKDIDYDGASGSAEFDENGDVGGYIGKFVVDGDGYKQDCRSSEGSCDGSGRESRPG